MIGTGPADEAIRSTAHEVLSREEYTRFRWVDPAWIDQLGRWLAEPRSAASGGADEGEHGRRGGHRGRDARCLSHMTMIRH